MLSRWVSNEIDRLDSVIYLSRLQNVERQMNNQKGQKCPIKNIICQEDSGCHNCQIYIDKYPGGDHASK